LELGLRVARLLVTVLLLWLKQIITNVLTCMRWPGRPFCFRVVIALNPLSQP
jgi:hypothetical protein